MLNAAVIGIGSMGKNHARIYDSISDVNLVAVSDIDEKSKGIADKYGAKFYIDYKEMLNNEKIDLISIAVPTKYHKEVALLAIEKEINVLLEKPIAIDVTNAKNIIDSAAKKDVKLMIGHIERFNPAIIELKKRLGKNELGKIYKIDVQRIGPFPRRIADVGVIIDLSVHDIDIINYLIDSKPKRICSEIQQKLHPNYEDSLIALIRYQNDVLAVLNVNYLSPMKTREILVFGEKGMFKVNYLTQQLKFYENPSFGENGKDLFHNVTEGKEILFKINKKESLLSEIEEFIECVKEDRQPLINGENGLYALEVAYHIQKAAKNSEII